MGKQINFKITPELLEKWEKEIEFRKVRKSFFIKKALDNAIILNDDLTKVLQPVGDKTEGGYSTFKSGFGERVKDFAKKQNLTLSGCIRRAIIKEINRRNPSRD